MLFLVQLRADLLQVILKSPHDDAVILRGFDHTLKVYSILDIIVISNV